MTQPTYKCFVLHTLSFDILSIFRTSDCIQAVGKRVLPLYFSIVYGFVMTNYF